MPAEKRAEHLDSPARTVRYDISGDEQHVEKEQLVRAPPRTPPRQARIRRGRRDHDGERSGRLARRSRTPSELFAGRPSAGLTPQRHHREVLKEQHANHLAAGVSRARSARPAPHTMAVEDMATCRRQRDGLHPQPKETQRHHDGEGGRRPRKPSPNSTRRMTSGVKAEPRTIRTRNTADLCQGAYPRARRTSASA